MRLDIVIPTLEEEVCLAANLPAALALADRVVVSDGGSTDRTREIARAHGAHWVEGPAGRGGQLCRGVEQVLADPESMAADPDRHVLLLLHADVRLPGDARRQLELALDAGAPGGGFRLVYDGERRIYRLAERLIHRRTLWTRCPLGDQAQWLRRDVWLRLGGMKSWPILEDLDLARRLKRFGNVAIIDSPVVASPRRFRAQGPLHTVCVDWLIWALYFLGVSPDRLAGLYRPGPKQ